ncbi:hypothetical protein PH586_03330 [Pseudomonas sp. SA3-5]|uniref:Uncharacterized protein n=1 Tax=Pseudomonas aestuarii TaxID=3018340 RepID=A0ABT4XAK4_9PSED|nr:hypothetical protein [Pseudomonas aestuarii]MDA7085423.1 hypothetical protein [Pseudomonas aestuarii]
MPADEPSLPGEVLLLLQQDRREEAIELLQVRQGISAQEAEERINRYQEENPPICLRGPGIVARSKLNALIWLGLIVLMTLTYLLLVG